MKVIKFLPILFLFLRFQASAQTLQTDKMADFMDMRFGMFIHFGPVTLRGTEIGWSRNKEVNQADYDSLYKEFDPALFNADKWVKIAKQAGMKYLVITAKHHDGFCLWPSHVSSYNVMNTPFKRDIVGELAAACKKQGMIFGIYFTVLDWHDPNYPIHNPNDSTTNVKGDMSAFKQTMKSELKELIQNYKPYLLWFDGYWEKPWKTEDGREIYSYIKQLDPNLIVNNRLGKVSEKLDKESVGDYLTPEQRIGQLNMSEPWESCITICEQWSWKPNDKMKSLKECLQTLVKTAAGNGNLLFNVGPMMDGRFEARQQNRLAEIGNWLSINGASIYKTKGGPYLPNETFATTRKDKSIYLHIFKKTGESIKLPAQSYFKVKAAHLIDGKPLSYEQYPSGAISVIPPTELPDANCSVIVLEIDRTTETIPIIKN